MTMLALYTICFGTMNIMWIWSVSFGSKEKKKHGATKLACNILGYHHTCILILTQFYIQVDNFFHEFIVKDSMLILVNMDHDHCFLISLIGWGMNGDRYLALHMLYTKSPNIIFDHARIWMRKSCWILHATKQMLAQSPRFWDDTTQRGSPGNHSHILENYKRINIGSTIKLQLQIIKLVLLTKTKSYIELHGMNKSGCFQICLINFLKKLTYNRV